MVTLILVCGLLSITGCTVGKPGNPLVRNPSAQKTNVASDSASTLSRAKPTEAQKSKYGEYAEGETGFSRVQPVAFQALQEEEASNERENEESSDTDATLDSPAVSLPQNGQGSLISPVVNDVAQGAISVEQVLESVAECYPEIEIAVGEIESAHGKVLASWGEFDRVLSGHSISQPLGFYQTYRNGVGLNRPLYGGGEVYGTYRIGDGNFEPWFGERETNEAGELKAGFSVPLLKDRNIDQRRAKLL